MMQLTPTYRPQPSETKVEMLCRALQQILPFDISSDDIIVVPTKTALSLRDFIQVYRTTGSETCSRKDTAENTGNPSNERCMSPVQEEMFPTRAQRTREKSRNENSGISAQIKHSQSLRIRIVEDLVSADSPEWVMREVIRSIIALGLGAIHTHSKTLFLGISSQLQRWLELRHPKVQRPLSQPATPVGNRQSLDLELLQRWKDIRQQYFPDRPDIDNYRLSWSRRIQTTVLASCNPELKRVTVARTMLRDECSPYLDALLFHEMCHAYAGIQIAPNGRRVMHGKDFKQLEGLHPGIPALDRWIKERGWAQAVGRERREMARGFNRKISNATQGVSVSRRNYQIVGQPHSAMKNCE